MEIQILGRGDEHGLPYVDLRFAGHADVHGACCIYPEPGRAAAAQAGQDWTFSTYLRRVGGTLDRVAAVNLYIDECGADGEYLDGHSFAQDAPTTDDLALQRFVATSRLRRPEVAGVTGYIQIRIAKETFLDVTLRMAGMQIERGAYASDLMLPPAALARE